jgi:hypothetical protein
MSEVVLDWPAFERNLAACLPLLEEDQFLVLNATDCYVQFVALGPDGMRAEAMSNQYAEETGVLLTERDCAALSALGWHLPTDEAAEPGAETETEGSPNFYLDASAPVDFGALASLALSTFRLGFEVGEPYELRYMAGSFSGESLVFSDLGIAPEER